MNKGSALCKINGEPYSKAGSPFLLLIENVDINLMCAPFAGFLIAVHEEVNQT
jgi:hypothetical protein